MDIPYCLAKYWARIVNPPKLAWCLNNPSKPDPTNNPPMNAAYIGSKNSNYMKEGAYSTKIDKRNTEIKVFNVKAKPSCRYDK